MSDHPVFPVQRSWDPKLYAARRWNRFQSPQHLSVLRALLLSESCPKPVMCLCYHSAMRLFLDPHLQRHIPPTFNIAEMRTQIHAVSGLPEIRSSNFYFGIHASSDFFIFSSSYTRPQSRYQPCASMAKYASSHDSSVPLRSPQPRGSTWDHIENVFRAQHPSTNARSTF